MTSQGLTDEQVHERVAAGKANETPDRSGRSVADIVRANVFTRINAILGVLFVIVISTGKWINAAFGLLIIANSAIGIIQELRAKKTLDELSVVGEAKPLVRRASGVRELPREEVVVDDIIEFGAGDQIIVDGEVVEADGLEVDESLLTGESDPLPKQPGDEVLSGSFVEAGGGAYRAVRVGREAHAAKLTAEASKFDLANSELQSGIDQILKVITWILIPVGIATILVQWNIAPDWREAVNATAGALVPMVPEGLVLLTSMAFALGVIRLGKRNCLVQELPAIELLARVDVVCADKTGTLTENKMNVSEVIPFAAGLEGEAIDQLLGQLAAADERPNSSMQAIAEYAPVPTDLAEVIAKAAFSSATKWSGVSFADGTNLVLGAPEVLDDGPAASQALELAEQGLRVLLLGQTSVPVDDADAINQVSPLALIVLAQTVRSDAKDTLDYFAAQGVDVKVISGDNPQAVGAIAEGLGLTTGEPVDARELETPERLAAAVRNQQIFGRVRPEQKRAMVSALQADGHIVAMTGDGVNDVLALKDADLGVAMGSGASATRSVAKVVLLDDKFATLPHVVGEGRRVLGNIERVASLFLSKTIYSAVLALLAVLFAVQFPFQAIHVTITGWFTIGIPAFFLALPPNNTRAQSGFVRRVMTLAVPAGLVIGVASFVTYRLLLGQVVDEATSTQASTAALATLIVASTWLLAVVARPYRWWKIALVVVAYLSYVLIFTLPLTQRLFILDSSNIAFMRTGLLIGLLAAALVEGIWWLRRGLLRTIAAATDQRSAAERSIAS